MPPILHVATTNAGKLRDFRSAVAETGIDLKPLPGLENIQAPDETARDFLGNATLKALHYSSHAPGLLVVADDSGLECAALRGDPGVRSARYAEDHGAFDPALGQDGSNNAALLLAMLEQTDRRARYRCVLALARDGQLLLTAEGSVDGELLTEPEGAGGFGFDPLFYLPELHCTMAQASPADRLHLSHRGRALRNLLQQLAA